VQLIMYKDPNSTKKTDALNVFFALLGSACVKEAHKMLVKSTPGLGQVIFSDS